MSGSGGDDGSDPPKPPQNTSTPEDKPDVTLDNSENLNVEGATVIDYYAPPVTVQEHLQYQKAAIAIRERDLLDTKLENKRAGYDQYKLWIGNEIKTRGLDPNARAGWREKVLLMYKLTEADLQVGPRGVVIS